MKLKTDSGSLEMGGEFMARNLQKSQQISPSQLTYMYCCYFLQISNQLFQSCSPNEQNQNRLPKSRNDPDTRRGKHAKGGAL